MDQDPYSDIPRDIQNNIDCAGKPSDCLMQLIENPDAKDAILEAISKRNAYARDPSKDWGELMDKVKEAYMPGLPEMPGYEWE